MTTIATRFLSVDPHMKNMHSSTVKFDISNRGFADIVPRTGWKIDNDEVSLKNQKPKEWELDVRSLTSSRKWLQNYGLKKNRLQLNQILPSIGFKLSDEFDETLKKPVSSRYGGGLFRQLLCSDGKTINVSCTRDKLLQLEKRLLQAVYLFKRRLEWLTTESRRVFGVIEERSVTIILDIRNMSPQQFDQYRTALERVLREQVSYIAKFNLIRASEDIQCYSSECAPVSHDTIENAIQWLWNLDRLAPVSNTASAEAIMTAVTDNHNEAIYLFTEGSSIDSGKEILRDKVTSGKIKLPIHVVSFNCESSDTIKFLKDFSKLSGGRFHAYGVVMELDAYEAQTTDSLTNRANIMLKRKTFGGIPPGAGVREDVVLVFEEMEEARNNLAQIRLLIERAPEPNRTNNGDQRDPARPLGKRDEQYMSSKEWLEIYGLDARGLGLYDVLSGVAFKHQDGIIDVMQPPPSQSQTDAIVSQKLVNARYCEKFPIVKWKDGRVVHVQVTPEVHRSYEERVQVALNKVQQRIDWLNQGSRSLFGTVVEDQIYILIDTSASMKPSLGFVKQKLFVLMQEQLRHKKKFNIVNFNSKAVAWKDRLVDVSERSLQGAWSWVQNLSCWGSTNTYAAIQLAMADPHTEAIYLLTDGRPDQPPKSIIAQVQMQKSIPIHTISFNCNDKEANQFLYELSEATDGRYHYYSEAGPPVDQPEAWESMDIKILKDEITRGLESLDKLANLRDECTSLSWKKEVDDLRVSVNSARKSVASSMELKELQREERPLSRSGSYTAIRKAPSPRPSSAPPVRSLNLKSITSVHHTTTSVSQSHGGGKLRGSAGLPIKLPHRPKSAKVSLSKKPLLAGHTRTSLYRCLTSGGRFTPSEWLLPETKHLFEQQAERQKSLAAENEKKKQIRKKENKKLLKASEMSSKQWLSKHGLVAKRLTILDALGSTFVSHKAKYVSILDKYVMSKVFDEVMPITHVSGSQQVRFVNPNGVNLKEYENKLQTAIDSYRKRLNKIVWDALPESARDDFSSDDPRLFEENRVKLLMCLEEADSPVKEQDVTLLADEIARGEKFMRQSEALRKAAAGEYSDDDNDDDDDKNTYDLPSRPRSPSPRSERSQKCGSSAPVSQRSEERSQKVESVRSQGSRASKDYEGLGQVMKSDNNVQGKVKEKAEVIKTKMRIKLDTLKGQTIIARRDMDGLYYPAVVVKCPDTRHALVRYDGGDEANVLTRNVIPVGGAVARPPLSAGDYVLIRVVHLDNKDECYVPAIIQVEPQRTADYAKFYTVVMYNGQKASTLRKHLVKISKERFELASMYISEQQNEDREEAKDKVYLSPRSRKSKERATKARPDDKRKKQRHPPVVSNRYEEDSSSRSSSEERQIKERTKGSEKKKVRRKTRSQSSSRSRSRSRSSDEDRSRSKSKSKNVTAAQTRSRSRSHSRSPSRSRSRSHSRSPSRSRSRSSSRASSPEKQDNYKDDFYAKDSPVPSINDGDSFKEDRRSPGDKETELEQLQQQLLEQQKKQERQRRKLKKKAKRLSRKEKDLKSFNYKDDDVVIPGPEDQEDGPRSAGLIQLRKSLPSLRTREEVLARWSDDGWYYRGIVKHCFGDCSYNIEDSTGYTERIWREDIISENDDASKIFELGNKVIALHPDYNFSYAPGIIQDVNDSEVTVEFYDDKSAILPWNEAYHCNSEKYQLDVDYIVRKEDQLVGAAVVARDDKSGAYFPGTVKEKCDGGKDYKVVWASGKESVQGAIHIFSAFTRRPNLSIGDRVLACVDPVHVKFLPGYLVGCLGDELVVKFCNGETREDIDPALCYWLGKNYYDAAVKYYKTHDPSFY